MDKPVWDHCTEEDPCVMPNIKRTPDISVVIFPDDYEKNISYPIFIAEVLGKKDPGPQYNQRYEGYNAAMQSLVFAPRCYYFEIGTISPSLYMLQKNPKEGTVTAKKKNYVLRYPSHMMKLINDLSRVFLDELINLRPIAHLSSLSMRNRNYKDFLSPPPGRGVKLQIHCWHIFVPEYHNSNKGPVPDEYKEELDREESVQPPEYKGDEMPDLTTNDLDNSVLEVTQYNVKDDVGKFEDSSYCRAHRNEFGTPSDLRGKTYSAFVQQKAQAESDRVILGDVARLLNKVGASSKDNKLHQKITSEPPEINPQGVTDASDIWNMTTDHRSLFLTSQQDPSVKITSPYPAAVLLEDETIDFDVTPPEEPVATLKFPKFTSSAIRKFHDWHFKELAKQVATPERYRTQDPNEVVYIPDEWTPGKPTAYKEELKRMVEDAEKAEGPLLRGTKRTAFTRLGYDTPGNISA